MTSAASLFPLVRHLSNRTSPYLIQSPVSANQVTSASLIFGIAGCWCMTQPGTAWQLAGGLLLVACYVLDNCDGEVARAKDQCTTFGEKYDSFVDWVVHAVFFAALGLGVARETGNDLWLWLGLIAAAGSTINYMVGIFLDIRSPLEPEAIASPPMPKGPKQWLVFIFRELTRADFCFIVLFLALFGANWLLLPAAALGAHVYWVTIFIRGAREYHV